MYTINQLIGFLNGYARRESMDLQYQVCGVTAIQSAKNHEVCVVEGREDLEKIRTYKSDVKIAVVSKEFHQEIPDEISCIVVDDAAKAGQVLIELFSE